MTQVKVKKSEAFSKINNRLKKGYRALGNGQYVKVTKTKAKTKAKSKVGRRRGRV